MMSKEAVTVISVVLIAALIVAVMINLV